MQLANVIVRLGGDLNNTVPRRGVTPAEILVLKHIHGSDAVVDVMPAGDDRKLRHEEVFARLSAKYDPSAGAMVGRPGDQPRGVLQELFPGAMKKLPTTLSEIGYDFGDAASLPAVGQSEPIEPAAEVADEPEVDETSDDSAGDGEAPVAETAAE